MRPRPQDHTHACLRFATQQRHNDLSACNAPGRSAYVFDSTVHSKQVSIQSELPRSADKLQRGTACIHRPLLLIGGLSAMQQSIDISCPPGPQQQTRQAACRGGRMGQTDRRTLNAGSAKLPIIVHRNAPCTQRQYSNSSLHD